MLEVRRNFAKVSFICKIDDHFVKYVESEHITYLRVLKFKSKGINMKIRLMLL